MGGDIQPSNPPASTICTIQSITGSPARYKNVKLRFLGCVDAYDIHTAVVILVHSGHKVQVDVSILLGDIWFSLGDWINVIGYFEEAESGAWIVKAVMAWPVTPGFNLTQYEDAVKSRMEATL